MLKSDNNQKRYTACGVPCQLKLQRRMAVCGSSFVNNFLFRVPWNPITNRNNITIFKKYSKVPLDGNNYPYEIVLILN